MKNSLLNINLGLLYSELEDVLDNLKLNLALAYSGNKAASQRFRTSSIKFEKMAKIYRALSVKEQKKSKELKTHKKINRKYE